MKKPPNSVAIIGGGVSGLACAYYLQTHTSNVSYALFEKGAHLGGNVRTLHASDLLIETGPDAFLYKPNMQTLLDELKISNQLISPKVENRKLWIVRDGNLKKVPAGFYLMGPSRLGSFLLSDAVSLSTKIRTLMEPWVPAKSMEDESLASFVKRRFGEGNLREITQPMIGGIYTADPERLSLKATLPKFIEWEETYGSVLKGLRKELHDKGALGPRYHQFRSFENGMQTLIDALQTTLDPARVRLETPVTKIEKHNQKWRVHTDQTHALFDHVILATPPRPTLQLCPFLPEKAVQVLQSVEYSSCALAHFAFDAQDVPEHTQAMGMIVPHQENKTILAATFCSQKFPNRAPQNKVLLRVFLGGALHEDLMQETDESLLQKSRSDLRDLLGIEKEPLFHNIIRWPHSMPQYTLGHQKRMQQFFESVRNLETLDFVGNAYAGVGIPDLIDRARQTVTTLMA